MPHKGYKQTDDHKSKVKKSLVNFKKGEDPRRFGKGSKHKRSWAKPKPLKLPKPRINKGLSLGKTSLSERVRKSDKYINWRKSIYMRDDYTCQFCSKRGVRLEADHIIPLSYLIKKISFEEGIDNILSKVMNSPAIWDINNGRTLCKECHKQTPTWGRKKSL